ncbi:cold-shock protein [Psychroserpens jangbogonensis]|uniref:cold-shock protein n=1 Tax=Psychroserpens jangbogonensis TaxID=1484460 RepID=UPI00053EDCDB|nr:hypothetical protein [Psychroserpens jangbogonensis]
MKLSKILTELGLTFRDIIMYEPYVGSRFVSKGQDISDELAEKIVTVYHTPEIQVVIKRNRKERPLLPVIRDYKNGYVVNNSYKLIATVKWYYNKAKNGEYGFVENNDLGDIFFRKDDFKGSDPMLLKEGDKVIILIDKKSVEYDSKIRANKAYPILMENDLKFLLLNLYELQNDRFLEHILSKAINFLTEVTEQEKNQFIDIIENLVTNTKASIQSSTFLYRFIQKNSIIETQKFEKFIINNCNSNLVFGLWATNILQEYPKEIIQTNLLKLIENQNSNVDELLRKISPIEQLSILQSHFNSLIEKDNLDKLSYSFNLSNELEIKLDTSQLSDNQKYFLWNEGLIKECPLPFILKNVFELTQNSKTKILELLHKLSDPDKKLVLELLYNDFLMEGNKDNIDMLEIFLKLGKEFKIDLNKDLLSEDQKFILWYNGVINEFSIKIVLKKLQELEKLGFNSNHDNYQSSKVEAKNIVKKISDSDLKNLIAAYYFDKNVINDYKTIDSLTFIIDFVESEELKSELINTVFSKSSDYCKLLLFVEDYTDSIIYDDVVLYTGLLSSELQKIFLKKIIKLIDENKIDLNLQDLNRILTIDYETSELAKEIDGVGLDFTLSIILKVITDLKNGEITQRNTIFELVANQIKNPKDLLVISGFFDKCDGRTTIEQDSKIENGEELITYKTKPTDYKARFSTFCDGRKSVIKGTSNSIACKKSGLEFWWCENSQCYDVCRKPHNSKDWKDYSLGDILRVLEIPFDNHQYEILLNVINRVNRFLEHLTCRSCNTILRPKGKSSYAFYGVSMFHCNNSECQDEHKDIYLSHCLNGQCYDIIDSRDTVKCKTEGFDDDCGWYICKNCHSCCSSEKLKARKRGREMNGLDYSCHTEGHKDRGVICCTSCGDEMKSNKINTSLYKQQLNWFIEHKATHPNILNSGQRPNGNKWWFIWCQGNFSFEKYRNSLISLRKNGFNIPDIKDESKTSQLVAEPFVDIERREVNLFTCTNCDNEVDLSDKETYDYGRINAIKKYHLNIFPTFGIK